MTDFDIAEKIIYVMWVAGFVFTCTTLIFLGWVIVKILQYFMVI